MIRIETTGSAPVVQNARFRRAVCHGLRSLTRRLPSLYGFNRYLGWQRRWTPPDEEYRVADVDRTITMFLRPYEFVDFALFYGSHLYERLEQQVLWNQLKPGWTFVDVGSHIGFYALLAAKRVGPDGRVLSFEPDPDTHARLVRNVNANPELARRIRAFEFAASDSARVARLYRTPDGNMGGNSLGASEGSAALPVTTTTLDQVFFDAGVDPGRAVVKIDVEGHELRVLDGFRRTLSGKRRPILVVEAADALLHRTGGSSEQLAGQLESHGYRLFEIARRGPRPLDRARFPAFANLLALPS